MDLRPTFRLGHNHGEETDSTVDITEPAAVKLEHDGGFGDQSRLFTDPGTDGGSRWTCKDTGTDLFNCLHFPPHPIRSYPPPSCTVNHGDHSVLRRLAGGPIRNDLHGDGVEFVGLQLCDDVTGGISSSAS